MQRSQSVPGGSKVSSLKGTATGAGTHSTFRGSALSTNAASASSSLDLSSVTDRSQLPIGVSKVVAARMRIDAELNPAMLEMRMNYRNLVNELQVHKGKLVSHQFALMKPRPKQVWSKPKELPCPDGFDPVLFKKIAKKRKKLKEQEERAELERRHSSLPAGDAEEGQRGILEDAVTQSRPSSTAVPEKEASPEEMNGVKDPTSALEVQEMTENENVKAVHDSLQEPAHSGGTLPRARLTRALDALGYHKPDEKLIKNIIKTMAHFRPECRQELELDEFCVIVLELQRIREAEIAEQFRKIDEDGSGSISMKEFRHLLWDLGYTVGEQAVFEIFVEVDQDLSGEIEIAEFEAALHIAHDRHGFTKAEVEALFDIFDRYDGDQSGEISADELASALGWFGTPTTIDQARQIIKRFDRDTDGSLCRPEFLMVMRARLEDEIRESRALFAEFDTNHTGNMDASELVLLFLQLGYTIPRDIVEEAIIEEVGPVALDTGLVFEDALKVLQSIRKRQGFSMKEVEELTAVYKAFDQGGDELREFELARAINWLGYPISPDRRRKLWIRVDRDKTNSIDEGEFLMVFRLLREEEAQAAQILLYKMGEDDLQIDERELKAMLNRLGYAPDPAIIKQAQEAITDSDGDGKADLLGVLEILKFIREHQVKKQRQNGGLSDQQATKIRNKFEHRIKAGNPIPPAEFEKWMRSDLFKTAKNSEAEHAKIGAIVRDKVPNGEGLELQKMFEIVRKYTDGIEEESLEREDQAAANANFKIAEVAQFREIFVNADDDGSGALSYSEILQVFANVLEVTPAQAATLKVGLDDMMLCDNKEHIDFPDFLRLMSLIHNRVDMII